MTNEERRARGHEIARMRAAGISDETILDTIDPGQKGPRQAATKAESRQLNRLHQLVDPNWRPRDQKPAQKLAATRASIHDAAQESCYAEIKAAAAELWELGRRLDGICAIYERAKPPMPAEATMEIERLLADLPELERARVVSLRRLIRRADAVERHRETCLETGLDIDLAEKLPDLTGRRRWAQRRLVVPGYRPAIKLEPLAAEQDDIESIMSEPPGGSDGTNRKIRRGHLLGHEKRKLPEPLDDPTADRGHRVCSCGLYADCYVHRTAQTQGGPRVEEEAAEVAVRTKKSFIGAEWRTTNRRSDDESFRPGDYERRYTAATSPSEHARHGPRPQPWHPRPPRARKLRESRSRFRPSRSVPQRFKVPANNYFPR